ncbi:MAG: hypothetical protein EOO85_01240 [Pedobacter sp.]|nr:MAG: hypothetical protein EOO85_01240 [Pedobacter sp.]
MKNIYLILTLLLFMNMSAKSQMKIGGTNDISPGAMLEVESTNRGFTPPRINLTSLTMTLNSVTPADGMIIYSTNASVGTGLFAWYSGKWNKILDKSNKNTYARFLGRATTNVSTLEWDPRLVNQPDGLLPMWDSANPSNITIRTAGLYIISTSYRKESTTGSLLTVKINGTAQGDVWYRGSTANYITPTSTYMYFLQVGDIITVSPGPGNVATDLGTTQISIANIPLIRY